MDADILVRVEHLSRFYGATLAVNRISFEVRRGEVLGFLGPNGAGKSTTMQMLTGNLSPSEGRIRINGVDILDEPVQAKARLGYLPEQPPLYREMTVQEFLSYAARLNRLPLGQISSAVDLAVERCGLGSMRRRVIANLSKGFQQRVGIAQAILHAPDVVILDEPTVGLDPIQIREIRDLIRQIGQDHSVILSTHILPEVQATCDRVQIVNRGELVLTDSIEGLQRRMASHSFMVALRRGADVDALSRLAGVNEVEDCGDFRYIIQHDTANSPAEAVARLAVEQEWGLYELVPSRLSLEEVFVDITTAEPAEVEPVTETGDVGV